MEIERKWLVEGWPEAELPLIRTYHMRQGYLVVRPTVRIREESSSDGEKEFILCLKSGQGLVREEIELPVPEERFREIERMIGLPLIPKERRNYALPDGAVLEVNHVDEGLPTEFWYAEVEFGTVEEAESWSPEQAGLAAYLAREVTDEEGQSMGAYWLRTRIPPETAS